MVTVDSETHFDVRSVNKHISTPFPPPVVVQLIGTPSSFSEDQSTRPAADLEALAREPSRSRRYGPQEPDVSLHPGELPT